MNDSSLTTSFVVDQTPDEVFAAINNVRGWWSGDIDGDTDRLGAVFTYRYKDIHRSKHEIIEFLPGKKVVWLTLDSYLKFPSDKTEWNGTKVVFEIAQKGSQTEVRFTHAGLVPQFECFDRCSGAWGFFINESLRSLITTGRGIPK